MPHSPVAITAQQQSTHERWLHEVTPLPTAAGKEQRVIEWIERWVKERDDLVLTRDDAGNLHIAFARPGPTTSPPLYFTAHMDHPAFVVEDVAPGGECVLAFRGGVMDEYFVDASVIIHTRDGSTRRAVLTGEVAEASAPPSPFKSYRARIEGNRGGVAPGDVAVWDVPAPTVEGDCFHTLACDDLAALVAALCAMDVLRTGERQDVRVLLTRAEEIGFIGAIAACRLGTIQRGSRVIALENSRAFPDSPIHGGPIVRVGDRLSIFTPGLTDAVAKRAEEIAGGASTVTASQKLSELPKWRWQRKLMAGGACEASVFCSYAYECTCVCLPLGNYHNMANLEALQKGEPDARAKVAREFIGVDDFHGLVDLLVACGRSLPESASMQPRLDTLWKQRAYVLDADSRTTGKA